MNAVPYLFFGGRCAEALDFYQDVLGAEIRTVVHFRDMPGAAADNADNVMHAEMALDGSTIFASDGGSNAGGAGFAMALQVRDDAEAERVFAALSSQGAVEVPLMSTPFASRFGKTTDRFGTPWMITTPQPVAQG
jgi:PhnB protein